MTSFKLNKNGQTIECFVQYKRVRNISLRYRDGAIYCTAPYFTASNLIYDLCEKFFKRLLKQVINKPKAIGNDFIYIFGERYLLEKGEANNLFKNTAIFKNSGDLQGFLKKILIEKVTFLVRFYEEKMEIKRPYKIHVRAMKTRYGSNSQKTHSLSFQLGLVHYDQSIIESVVVHELAHDKYFDHSKKFYEYVYKFCPNYKELRKKLIKGEFK